MDRISRATDIDHVELVPAAVTRAYFDTEGIRPGTEINIVVETENVGDNTDASITVFADDDNEFELDTLTGQISSNRLVLQYTPLDGVDDETALKESLGNDFFRTFKFKVRIESLDVDYDNSDNTLSIGLPGVVIEGIDEQFAPHEEQLEIRYRFIDILHEIQGARIKIYASNYESNNYPDSGALIYSEDILADDRPHDIIRTFRWYGNTTAESGPLQQPDGELAYVTPLFSPYTVEIILSTENADPDQDSDAKKNYKRIDEEEPEIDWQLNVAYHSIGLELGEHIDLDHAPDPDSTEWVQWRLNDLGYPCGPADGIEGDMTERALKNFQRANWQVPWPEDAEANRTPLEVNGDADDDTLAVLRSRTQVERRTIFSSADDLFTPDRNVKLYTWANIFYSFQADVEDGEQEWDNSNRDEWWDSRFNPRMFPRQDKEARVLNRPWVPIIAKVMLKNRSGEAIFCPWGVGNVRVNFSVNDPAEDMEVTSSEATAAPRRYVNGARQQISTATGDNCPEDHAGIRVADANENYKKYLHIGDNLDPYESQDDSSRHIVYVEAPTEGRGRGSAGIYFIPSYTAGDDFKLRAELDFQDHPNRENIEPESGPFRAETATITNCAK